MSDTTIFEDTNQAWTTIIMCLILLGLAFFSYSYPSDDYFIENNLPIPDNPVIVLIFAIVAIMVFCSWWQNGMPHKEREEEEDMVE